MKYTLAVAALIGSISAVHLRDYLPDCPKQNNAGFVGTACRVQVESSGVTLIQLGKDAGELESTASAETFVLKAPASVSSAAAPLVTNPTEAVSVEAKAVASIAAEAATVEAISGEVPPVVKAEPAIAPTAAEAAIASPPAPVVADAVEPAVESTVEVVEPKPKAPTKKEVASAEAEEKSAAVAKKATEAITKKPVVEKEDVAPVISEAKEPAA